MKTIIVYNQLLFARKFEEKFGDFKELEVVGSFGDSNKALEYAKENLVDFAFLDIEMPEMNALELGKRLKEIHPKMVLVYMVDYAGEAADISRMKADYCIMKSSLLKDMAFSAGSFLCGIMSGDMILYKKFDMEDVREWVKLFSKRPKKNVMVHMFGRFDIFLNEQVVYFKNAKSKELLALCLDRCGGSVWMEEAIDKLWPDRVYDEKVKRLYRKAVMDLRKTLGEKNIVNFFKTRRGMCYICKEVVECDYYAYLEDPVKKERMFHGEYLFDYSWGEETLALLMNGY